MKVLIDNKLYAIKWNHGLVKKGMTTHCYLRDNDGKMVSLGIAKCGKKDNFCKETGRKISLTRAIKEFPKEIRRDFWKCYLNRGRNGNV